MAICGPKPSVNYFGKVSIFRLFKLLDFIAYNGVLWLYNTVKELLRNYLLQKKSWNNGHFWTKTMRYLPWKNVNFSTVSTSCFYSLDRRFLVLEYCKRNFPGLYCLKKTLEKQQFLDQNHGSTPLEKCQFFDFFNFLLLQPRKAFICSRIS